MSIEVIQQNDLMSNSLSNIWLEIKGKGQKILICAIYREFNELTKEGKLTINQQIERLKVLFLQIELAEEEGLALIIGDMNIDIEKLEDSTYHLRKLANEYQLMINECGLKILNFGPTWNRNHKDGKVLFSAVQWIML